MARFAKWLIEAPSWTLAGMAGTAIGAVAGGGLYVRQAMLKDHQVCRAATEQLEGAEAVLRAQRAPPWWRHSSLPWPQPEADSPGAWLRRALGTSFCAAQGPTGG